MTWDDALVWADGHTALTAADEARIRPWSTTQRFDSPEGFVWLKATAAGTRSEASLMNVFTAVGTPLVLTPLAIEVDRGFLLLPDGGPTLRAALDRHPDLGEWERLLPRYAELQRSLEGVALPGVEDHSPAAMPALLDEMLSRVETDLRAEIEGLKPRYAEWCADLASSSVTPTVQHDDLHDGNVFANHVVFDWGDAVLAHPFASLLVTLRTIAARFSLGPGAPELERLRDCYLEAWTDEHSRVELELLSLLATRVGKVSRSHGWWRALEGSDPGEHAEAVPGWLEELLEPDVF